MSLGLMRFTSAPVSTSAKSSLEEPSEKVHRTLTFSFEHLGIPLAGLWFRDLFLSPGGLKRSEEAVPMMEGGSSEN